VSSEKIIKLGELNKNQKALIVKVGRAGDVPEFIDRLLEMGLLEGSVVEVMHEAPFGGDPLAIRVRGALIALRRNEANAVEVSIL
jgi:ferrous iron transport protein A